MLTIYIHKKREKSDKIGCLFNQMNYKYQIFLLLFIPIIGLIMIYSIAEDTNLNVSNKNIHILIFISLYFHLYISFTYLIFLEYLSYR